MERLEARLDWGRRWVYSKVRQMHEHTHICSRATYVKNLETLQTSKRTQVMKLSMFQGQLLRMLKTSKLGNVAHLSLANVQLL